MFPEKPSSLSYVKKNEYIFPHREIGELQLYQELPFKPEITSEDISLTRFHNVQVCSNTQQILKEHQ